MNHDLYDSVRGGDKRLIPNSTATEASYSNLVQSFNRNGFNVGTSQEINKNSATVVAWCWKAGGNSNTFNIDGKGYATATAAGLDGGSIDPTGASINTEAGFSMLTYTGTNNASETIAHGLGKKPAWILVKARNVAGQDWVCLLYTSPSPRD